MVTLRDIANKTGFSLSVVSRALNHNPDQQVAVQTKRIIEKAMRDLNYRRNHAASQLARGRSIAIGVFLPSYGYSLTADMVIGMSEAAAAHDFQCNFYFGLDGKDYLRFINSVKTSGSAGLLTYMWSELSAAVVHQAIQGFQREGGQVLLLNAPPVDGIDTVSIDNHIGGSAAAEHLLAQGCDDFCCLTTVESWQTTQRWQGFAQTVQAHGHQARKCTVQSMGFHEYGLLDLKAMLGSSTGTLGLFAMSDYLAMHTMRQLSDEGLLSQVGRRIRLIGYDNIPGSQYTSPALTTIEQPFRAFGHHGMSHLLHLVAGTPVPDEPLALPRLIVRESA